MRTKVLGLVDVMMRVPPVMVIDEILKIGMGLPTRLYPDKSIPSDSATASSESLPTESPSLSSVDSSQDAFATIKAFFGLGEVADQVTAAGGAAQAALEQSIENASRNAQSHGMLSSGFNNLMDELAHDETLSAMLSITTVKFVICLFGEFRRGQLRSRLLDAEWKRFDL